MQSQELAEFLTNIIYTETANAQTTTHYREPLVRWAHAHDPRFSRLRDEVHPDVFLPQDMLSGAKSVVVFFLPFGKSIVHANARAKDSVAVEWAQAYIETNGLLKHITDTLTYELAKAGIRACAEPPTHNFDPVTLRSHWSHKSVAVIAGLGSFGLHRMVITDAGCAGRFTSLVLDAALPHLETPHIERCLYFVNGSCTACVQRCPVGALHKDGSLDKGQCWEHCLSNGETFKHLGLADVCGQCAIGPCSFTNPVQK